MKNGVMEYWVGRPITPILHYSIIPCVFVAFR